MFPIHAIYQVCISLIGFSRRSFSRIVVEYRLVAEKLNLTHSRDDCVSEEKKLMVKKLMFLWEINDFSEIL